MVNARLGYYQSLTLSRTNILAYQEICRLQICYVL